MSTFKRSRKLWSSFLLRLYATLTRNDAVQPSDLIFVMAGRMERKHYGLELARAGVAPHLVLSVGRFEVSKMHTLALQGTEDLIALRKRTSPDERHFFVKVNALGVNIDRVILPKWSTYGEALALRQFLEREKARRVIVISTDVHLRRIALTFGKVFQNTPVEFRYCPVPGRFGFLDKEEWWTRPEDRRFVMAEMLKLIGYRIIFLTPAWAVRRLMRLKDR
jgi:uncharacterized SAM-binding protein YcdF (DUF218 family)